MVPVLCSEGRASNLDRHVQTDCGPDRIGASRQDRGRSQGSKATSELTGTTSHQPGDTLGDSLKPFLKAGEEIVLAAILYNGHIATTDLAERIRGALSTAAAYFDAKRPLDVLKAAMGDQAAADPKAGSGKARFSQQNFGLRVKSAARDYYEGDKKPKGK